MLTLLCYAPDDRYAFVREGDRYFSVRPHHADVEVQEHHVERAVTVHGFTVSDREFAAREEIDAFLADESVRAWRAAHGGQEVPSLETLRTQLAQCIPTSAIERMLCRKRKELDDGDDGTADLISARLTLECLAEAPACTEHQRARIVEMVAEIQRRDDGMEP